MKINLFVFEMNSNVDLQVLVDFFDKCGTTERSGQVVNETRCTSNDCCRCFKHNLFVVHAIWKT